MSYDLIELTFKESVATLTLDRPPLNVMNIEMMEQINEALLELKAHPELKVLVIRGKGKAFSAGVDIADHTQDKVARMLQVFHRIPETIRLLDVIAVAAVDGMALGGGFELAIGCNLVVASESVKFAVPEITAFGYGFPNDKAYRVGVKMLKYHEIRKPQTALYRKYRAKYGR